MENVIKRIFSEKIDEDIHNEFIKFSRGIFANKYLLDAKKQKDNWTIKTGYEFANFLVRKCLDKISEEVEVKGIIVFTGALSESKIPIERVKQFMGIKQYVINTKANSGNIIDLMNRYPKAFFALSFKFDNGELKIKAKAPKGAKPSTKGGVEPKADFCSLKTKDESLVRDLFFDFADFKEIYIKHTLQIDSIELPKGIADPMKMRELSKRKGKIIREIRIDGRTDKKEVGFEA